MNQSQLRIVYQRLKNCQSALGGISETLRSLRNSIESKRDDEYLLDVIDDIETFANWAKQQ